MPAPSSPSSARDHPRIRGEHPPADEHCRGCGGSSPHTRGARIFTPFRRFFRRIIPAYAGSTPKILATEMTLTDHPRIRGEHIGAAAHQVKITGSSPHTRGALFPAFGVVGGERDHPRIRGEHGVRGGGVDGAGGSSPHTRGAHLEIPAIPRIAAVIIPVFLYPSPTPQEEADRSMVLLTLS